MKNLKYLFVMLIVSIPLVNCINSNAAEPPSTKADRDALIKRRDDAVKGWAAHKVGVAKEQYNMSTTETHIAGVIPIAGAKEKKCSMLLEG